MVLHALKDGNATPRRHDAPVLHLEVGPSVVGGNFAHQQLFHTELKRLERFPQAHEVQPLGNAFPQPALAKVVRFPAPPATMRANVAVRPLKRQIRLGNLDVQRRHFALTTSTTIFWKMCAPPSPGPLTVIGKVLPTSVRNAEAVRGSCARSVR